ncbi:MAG: cyclase family protein [Silvanigrellales bacterium]|nr:cyclase family protein [Silvanigrellales bacterium]
MNDPKIIDISPRVSPRLGVFPGDVSFQQEVALNFVLGSNLMLSSIRSTVHIGAHADAPCHYVEGGADIASVSLQRYLGLCEVVSVNPPRGERVRPEHLPEGWWPQTPRVLFHTGSFPQPENWNTDFCSLSPSLIASLAEKGVVLVGIDTPSIDPQNSKALESHAAVARAGLSILEGLVLSHVKPGLYTLVALPLALEGLDASPVRAVLLPPEPKDLGYVS